MADEPLSESSEDWRAIATALYHALGAIEANTPGGSIHWPSDVQPAIDEYEYATDREDARG